MIAEREMTMDDLREAARVGADFAAAARFYALRMETPLFRNLLSDFAQAAAEEAAAFLVAVDQAEFRIAAGEEG